jgi:hypothetical protein
MIRCKLQPNSVTGVLLGSHGRYFFLTIMWIRQFNELLAIVKSEITLTITRLSAPLIRFCEDKNVPFLIPMHIILIYFCPSWIIYTCNLSRMRYLTSGVMWYIIRLFVYYYQSSFTLFTAKTFRSIPSKFHQCLKQSPVLYESIQVLSNLFFRFAVWFADSRYTSS